MSDARLEQLRGDLEIMQEAAGFALPFGWEDVWLSLGLVPLGVVVALSGALGNLSAVRWSVLPFVVVFVAAAIGLRVRYRRSTGRSPTRRREYTLGLAAGFSCALIAAIFLAWARRLGESTALVGGLAVSMTAGLCFVLALTSPGRRCLFAAAVPLLAYGAVIPLCSPRQVVTGGGALLVITGLAAAAIQAWQLRAAGGDHERAAH